MTPAAYLRYPHIHGDLLAFVAGDEVWLAPAGGGRAWPLTGDGDIITAAISLLGLGPVVGTRTWGGVIGFDDFRELVDGTQITVPQLAFSFDGLGWGVENYGVAPDVEVDIAPADWANGRDPQLETAVRLALEALDGQPATSPPDPLTGPRKARPPLPPRPARRPVVDQRVSKRCSS